MTNSWNFSTRCPTQISHDIVRFEKASTLTTPRRSFKFFSRTRLGLTLFGSSGYQWMYDQQLVLAQTQIYLNRMNLTESDNNNHACALFHVTQTQWTRRKKRHYSYSFWRFITAEIHLVSCNHVFATDELMWIAPNCFAHRKNGLW